MLNIPESVKRLYKTDGVRKNFRAHFPNGELPDITNADIVKESVRFTESVCSQDVFKFGLTEAGVIEFETVGVGNMYGMTIECSSEIDLSSLSEEDLAEIEAGSWDGEYVGLADSDLGYPFFRIPYGRFRVESCPRDHQAMAHRKVTGYTRIGRETLRNEFEQAKDAIFLPSDKYTPDMWLLSMSTLAQYDSTVLEKQGFTKKVAEYQVIGSNIPNYQKDLELKLNDGTAVSVGIMVDYHKYQMLDGGNAFLSYANLDSIIEVELGNNDYSSVQSGVVNALKEAGIDPLVSGYESYEQIFSAFLEGTVFPWPCFTFDNSVYDYGSKITLSNHQIFYPYRSSESGSKRTANIIVPVSFSLISDLWKGAPNYGVFTAWKSEKDSEKVYEYTSPAGLSKMRVYFNSTLKQTRTQAGEKVLRYSFVNAFSLYDMLVDCLELHAAFAAPNRHGGCKLIKLSKDTSFPITPNEYSSLWWDEYNVEAIGTVRYAYTDDAGEEQVIDYKFGDGASVYEMTDNVVLKALDGADPEMIQAMLDEIFIPNLAPVNFTPIDLSMKGLPYLEAGDYLTVTAQDGTIASSFLLRHELEGVQALSAQIDSESGLIIDNKEAE